MLHDIVLARTGAKVGGLHFYFAQDVVLIRKEVSGRLQVLAANLGDGVLMVEIKLEAVLVEVRSLNFVDHG